MKNILLLISVLFITFTSIAQDITGDWHGVLDVQGTSLRMTLHISKSETGYITTLDSPDQNAHGIPIPKTTFEEGILILNMSNLQAEFKGNWDEKNNVIEGNFKQMSQSFPLKFHRETSKKANKPNRPQTPKAPYPYISEEITFYNSKQNVTLAGTLTLPEHGNNFTAVILITGSDPQNRDEEIFNHKPFLVIADYLTRHGIAVLRYDDRGVGESTGSFFDATTADFATDVEAAFEYLKTRPEINHKKIGLIGHSEGGIIAPIVASTNNDIGFIILLAGTGVDLGDVLLKQQELIGKSIGISSKQLKLNKTINQEVYNIIKKTEETEKLQHELKAYYKAALQEFPQLNERTTEGFSNEQFIEEMIKVYMNPWMRYAIAFDPAKSLEKVKCPVLALNGTKDLQVDAQQNLPAIEKALKKGGNSKVTIHKIKNLNHLFQESKTGSPLEYNSIEETFSPKALNIIKDWILNIESNK